MDTRNLVKSALRATLEWRQKLDPVRKHRIATDELRHDVDCVVCMHPTSKSPTRIHEDDCPIQLAQLALRAMERDAVNEPSLETLESVHAGHLWQSPAATRDRTLDESETERRLRVERWSFGPMSLDPGAPDHPLAKAKSAIEEAILATPTGPWREALTTVNMQILSLQARLEAR